MPLPRPPASAYPSPGSAILLCFALLGLQALFGGFASLIVLAGGGTAALNEPVKHLIYDAWIIGPINLLAFGLVLLWVVRRRRIDPAGFLIPRAFPWRLVAPVVVTTLGLTVALSAVDCWLIAILRHLPGFDPANLNLLEVGRAPVGSFLLFVVIAPLTEEIFFRGFVLRGLLGRLRVWPAILLAALLFGLIHANIRQFVLALVLGTACGHWLWRTGSTGPALLSHAVLNLVAFLASWRPDLFIWLGGWHEPAGLVHPAPLTTLSGFALALVGWVWCGQALRAVGWPVPNWSPPVPAVEEPPMLATTEPPRLADATPPAEPLPPQPPASPAS